MFVENRELEWASWSSVVGLVLRDLKSTYLQQSLQGQLLHFLTFFSFFFFFKGGSSEIRLDSDDEAKEENERKESDAESKPLVATSVAAAAAAATKGSKSQAPVSEAAPPKTKVAAPSLKSDDVSVCSQPGKQQECDQSFVACDLNVGDPATVEVRILTADDILKIM